ncbi:hypothetical protein L7F22_015599 [Adiantum nelumboides]|nr:hypothetical protein [Adiantum nelumboides]
MEEGELRFKLVKKEMGKGEKRELPRGNGLIPHGKEEGESVGCNRRQLLSLKRGYVIECEESSAQGIVGKDPSPRRDLHNNFLYGSIPSSLASLRNLTFLDLSFNNLSGGYPPELNNVTLFRIVGNPLICVNNSCIAAPAPVLQSDRSDSREPRGLIVGSVVAAVFVFAAAGLVCMLYKCKSQKKKRLFVAHSAHWPPVPPFAVIPKSVDSGIAAHAGGSDDVPLFSFAYMQNITNNFENKIAAEGGSETLYYGTLSDGQEVVVKFLKTSIKQTPMEFLYKVTPLSFVHHKNLLSPIGFCAESQHWMFIYERVQKGSLYDYLHTTDKHALDWKTRLSILLQVAQGLEHLHSSCSPGIIHGNLKSANVIFSGDCLLAKVSEFGIYELSSDVDATSGYLDPEYFAMKKLTEKSDIYSFGILTLEVVSGRMPYDKSFPRDAWNIIEWVGNIYNGGEQELIADPCLQGTYNKATLSEVVKLALQATDSNVDGRPNMTELVMELKEVNKTAVGHHVAFAVLDDSNDWQDRLPL